MPNLPAPTQLRPVHIARRERLLGRALADIHVGANLELAETRAIEAIEVAKLEALGSITQAGLAEVAHLSAAELALAEQHPYAFDRLRLISDVATLAIASRIEQAARRLG